jgi:hypothetical protein
MQGYGKMGLACRKERFARVCDMISYFRSSVKYFNKVRLLASFFTGTMSVARREILHDEVLLLLLTAQPRARMLRYVLDHAQHSKSLADYPRSLPSNPILCATEDTPILVYEL